MFIVPALPRSAPTPPRGPDWLHEIKFDGWRAQVHVGAGEARLLSRNGNDLSKRFPFVVSALGESAAKSAVLDGELVAVDPQGRCDFYGLLRRDPSAVCIRVFDLLAINGRDVREMPLVVRRARLQRLVAKSGLPCVVATKAL